MTVLYIIVAIILWLFCGWHAGRIAAYELDSPSGGLFIMITGPLGLILMAILSENETIQDLYNISKPDSDILWKFFRLP